MEIFDPIAGIYFNPLIITGIGVFAGMIAGMVGLGGGLILVPFMIVYGVAPNVAAATANCFMVSTSSSGLYAYLGKRQVQVKIGYYLIAGSILGGIFGVLVIKELMESGTADNFIRTCFAITTGLIGLFMLRDVFLKKAGENKNEGAEFTCKKYNRFIVVTCGLVAGVSSAILGIAGGVFVVPFLIYYLDFDTRTAVGTSLLHILFTTTTVSIFHSHQNQNLDIILAFFLIFGSGAGAQIGAYLSGKTSVKTIKMIFATIALAGAVRLGTGQPLEKEPLLKTFGGDVFFSDGIHAFSGNSPMAYGFISVGIALSMGLIWGKIFRTRKKIKSV